MKKYIGALGILMISLVVSACSDKENSSALFTVGGVVSGATGTLVLQNNGGDDLAVASNGPFTFPTATAAGRSYAVTVRSNPVGQTCIVENGSGMVLPLNVTNVSVSCYARGGLDVSFNSPNGFAVENNAAGGNGDDSGSAVAIDSQGRVVVAGSSVNSAGNKDMAVWRFAASGALDTSFNGSGVVVHNSAAGGNGDDIGSGIAIDSQDRILVTGSSTTTGGTTGMTVWRFNADGTIDATFNSTGFVVHDRAAAGTGSDSGIAIAIDSQGRILVTGSSTTTGGTTDMAVWRYNANGTVDTGFNKSGMVVHNSAAGGNGNDSGNGIAIDSQGRILVTGSSRNTAGNLDLVVWRYKADGTLDAGFNSAGIFVHNSAAGGNGDDSGNSIAIDSQGKIIVTGSSRNNANNTDMVIWRLTSSGALDTTLNGSGLVINNGAAGSNGDDTGNGVDVDSQGRIIVTGSSTNGAGDKDMVVWRFLADGTLDTTFAAGGILVQGNIAGNSAGDSGSGIAIDSRDKILITGSSMSSAGNSDMVIWRVFP